MADGQFERTIAAMDAIFSEVETARGTEASLGAKLATKQDALTVGTNLDGVVASGSNNPATSNAVWNQIYGIDLLGFASGDYNSYDTPGRWAVSSSSSYTMDNRPGYFAGSAQGAALILEVIQTYSSSSSTRLIQRLWISGARFFMRGYNSSRVVDGQPAPWFDWYEYGGTVSPTISNGTS